MRNRTQKDIVQMAIAPESTSALLPTVSQLTTPQLEHNHQYPNKLMRFHRAAVQASFTYQSEELLHDVLRDFHLPGHQPVAAVAV